MTTAQSAGPEMKRGGARAKTAAAERQSEVHPLARLHRSAGNQAVLRALSRTALSRTTPRIQTKLTVNRPGDKYEEEADRVADQVMRMPNAQGARLNAALPHVQRKCGCSASAAPCDCDSELTGKSMPSIQPKLKVNPPGDVYEREADHVARLVSGEARPEPESAAAPAPAGELVDRESLTRGGVELPPHLREFYEGRFGYDLSMVRLHTGPSAAQFNDRLQAHAFTFAEHIWLGGRQRADRSFVMAHELAHVIQQRQPPRLKSGQAGFGVQSRAGKGAVQRLPFFAPLNTSTGQVRTGTDIHDEILSHFTNFATQSGISIEAPVPNAVKNDVGIGYQGEADLYTSSNHKTVGIYFAKATGIKVGDVKAVPDQSLEPKAHRRAKGRDNAPRISDTGAVEGINEAPGKIWVNEMKPAERSMLESGATQLGFYKRGFEQAREWTNRWAAVHTRGGPSWPPLTVNIKDQVGKAPEPHEGIPLALLDIKEGSGTTGKIKIENILASPTASLAVQMRGDLRVKYFKNGLWMYYARPNYINPLPGSGELRGALETALLVQSDVIGVLTKAPHEVSTLPLRTPAIQRKDKKPAKLEDDFVYDTWNDRRKELHKIIEEDRSVEVKVDKAKKATVTSRPGGKSFGFLKFLELANQAEESTDTAAPDKASLPKIKDVNTLLAAAQKDDAGKPLNLGKRTPFNAYTWAERWTSEPASVLGRFRNRFKGAFIGLANLISGHGKDEKDSLLGKISAKMQAIFSRLSAGKAGSALANFAIKGVAFAIRQLSGLLLPSVVRVLSGAIKAGIKDKLAEIFDLDVVHLVKKKFDEFEEWWKEAKKFGDTFGTIFDDITTVLETISSFVKTFEEVRDYIDKAATIVKWGIRALQCSGVISCLSLLFESLKEKAIALLGDKALETCGLRYLMAKGVHELFSGLPGTLARGVLKILRKLTSAFGGLSDIFAEKYVHDEAMPDPSEIVDDDCWSINLGFSFMKGFKKSPKPGKLGEKSAGDDLEDLMKFGEGTPQQKTESLVKLMKKMGITDATPMTGRTLRDIQGALKKVEAKDIDDRTEGKASKATDEKLKPLTEKLDQLTKDEKVVQAPVPSQPAPPVKGTPGRAPAPTKPADKPTVWSPARMGIGFTEGKGYGTMEVKVIYVESLEHSNRLSQDRPIFQVCEETGRLLGGVTFWVDHVDVPRPQPFKAPKVAIEWRVNGKVSPFRDDNPRYKQPWLVASFGPPVRVDGIEHVFEIPVKEKDVLELKFTLVDEDSKTSLQYEDKLPVRRINCH